MILIHGQASQPIVQSFNNYQGCDSVPLTETLYSSSTGNSFNLQLPRCRSITTVMASTLSLPFCGLPNIPLKEYKHASLLIYMYDVLNHFHNPKPACSYRRYTSYPTYISIFKISHLRIGHHHSHVICKGINICLLS